MLSLTISDIQYRLQANELPQKYTIKTPVSISSSDLVWTLMLFKNNNRMLQFIALLSENDEITIEVNNKTIQQGSVGRFVHAYAEHGFFPQELDEAKQQDILTFLKKQPFPSKELAYLLMNLDYDAINDFLLSSKCFSEQDLLALCNDIETLKKLASNSNKIKLLYHYFNKVRRWEASLTPLLDMYYFAYRAGHVMGLGESIDVTINSHQYQFETEYAPAEVSLRVLSEHLNAYSQSQPEPTFSAISQAVKNNLAWMLPNTSSYRDDAYEKILAQYKNNELTFLSSGWPGHAVGLVLYGDYLIYTNRGDAGFPKFGSKIFKIADRDKICKNFIRNLLNAQTPEAFHRILGRIIDFRKSIFSFLSKYQKYANCTFANPKACVEPMIVLQRAGPFAREKHVKRLAYQEQGRQKYKQFTTFIRDREIDELVKNMFYAKHPHLMVFFAALVKRIIGTHHGGKNNPTKDQQELRRAFDLFERTPAAIQSIIKTDKAWMSRFTALKNAHPISPNPMLLHQYTTVTNMKQRRSHAVTLENGYITCIDGVQTPKTPYSFKNARKLCTHVLKYW